MKYVTYLYDNKESVGFLNESDNAVYPLPFADMNALIEAPKEKLEVVIKEAKNKILLSDVTLLAPIPRPKPRPRWYSSQGPPSHLPTQIRSQPCSSFCRPLNKR